MDLAKRYELPTVGRIMEDSQRIKITKADRRIETALQKTIWEIT